MSGKYERFSTSIASISRDIQRIERTEMAKCGLTGPCAQSLLTIGRFPEGIPAARLAQLCEKDKAAISRTVAELEQAGLVRRAGASRYRANLQLTEAGRKVAASIGKRAQLAVELAGEGLSAGQLEGFYQVLDHIAQRLHTLGKTGLEPQDEQEETT